MYFAPLVGAVRGIHSEYRAMSLARRNETEQRQARASNANDR